MSELGTLIFTAFAVLLIIVYAVARFVRWLDPEWRLIRRKMMRAKKDRKR